MRVIAGQYKGRRLKTLDGMQVRPTSDRLRETIFNVLASRIVGARFLDICAGSGAVGIEALSRGAAPVTLIESSRRAAAVISENLRHCGIAEGVRVVNRDALSALKYFAAHGLQFDLCYFDPPYDSELYGPVMWHIARHELIAPAGAVIVEHRRQLALAPAFDRLRSYREITQGESRLTFYRMEGESA
jgi:16S rRNA (guanine(966)-N(2))-methyltransferase RsmD